MRSFIASLAFPALLSLVSAAPTDISCSDSNHCFQQSKEWKDSSSDEPVKVDVVVVGGGFSGMAAAYEIQKAGLSSVVLEAKEKIGGRSRSHKLKDGPGIVELGACWINNETQPQVFSLVEEFGLTTVVQPTTGIEIREWHDGSIHRNNITEDSDGDEEEEIDEEDLPEEVLLEYQLGVAINMTAEAMSLTDFDFPVEQDVTFAEWVEQNDLGWESEYMKKTVSLLTTSIVGREPDEIGAHYFLDYIKAGNGLESLLSAGPYGAQQLLLAEGTTSIVSGIEGALKVDSVFTDTPVTSITQQDGTVLVETESGKQFEAKKVIFAFVPTMYSKIKFSPELPKDKQELEEANKGGIYAKIALTYSSPWWQEAGLLGSFYSFMGPITYGWATVVESTSQYSITMFTAGDFASEWFDLPEAEKGSAIVDHLVRLVGEELEDKARDTLEINYAEWTKESYIEAGPTSAMGPGMLRKYGETLREPFENIHFAGTETSYEWKGYLEGAVLAGQRAAEEIIEKIGSK